MVDAIISAVVEDLTSMLRSSKKEEVKLMAGINDEVEKFVSNFKSIQALLDDAEERQLKQAFVKKWLFDLKSVSYDMDDVIDEWKTWIQRSQLQHQHHSSGSNQNHLKHKVLYIFPCICFPMRDGHHHVVARKIREIQQRLDDIADEKDRYQLTSSQKTDKHIERHETTFFFDMRKVKGRDEEKHNVKSQILKAKSNPHIISLVGMGGIGKTTLAQLVYNDREIKDHFDKRIWVCVSESFDEICIANAILKSIDSSIIDDLKKLENVLEEIHTILCEKKFLLVLDDIWNENRKKWEELEIIFKCGLPGSTILVTTCNERVAINMGCKPESIHKVGLLTSEECWSIISQTAHTQSDHQKLESIGKRIADKCKGSPLIATTIGGLLRFKKSEEEWLRVLEKKEWEGEDILGPLKRSYYDLPLTLKQCFKYCAIFSKESKISKRRLIRMWMAQGYLKREEKDEDLEMIGETYFDNLIARSLLQISYYNDSICMLHGMVSDLAQTFTKGECLMIEVLNDTELNGNSLYADANIRHLTLTIENDALFPEYIYNFTKLRSLIIQLLGYRSSLIVDILKNIFDHLTCLRTLDLSSCDIEEIPSSINRLVHLRWLDLSANTNLKKLPETLCECYNLQTLILKNCYNLVELPQGIGKLINLMYLDIESCDEIKYLPKGIGNLWHLKELTVFIVSGNKYESCSIVEMEMLDNLKGRLEIKGLGNVRKLEEARKAQLVKKKNVIDLRLSFDKDDVQEDRDDLQEDEEELLKTLEPPSDLEILYIDWYDGKTLMLSWMMKLKQLKELWIKNCENFEELPQLGKLPCLEELYLENMRVKRVGIEFMGIEKEKDASTNLVSFPKLKILCFDWFQEWEEWNDIEEWLMERINKTITVMPYLQQLTVRWCPKLKTLPYHLLSPSVTTRLQNLNISFCAVLQQEVQKDKLSHIPHLTIRPATQTVFIVSVNEDESSSIVEMEQLNNLRGRLVIRGLGNVRKLEEARKAQLQKKKSVTELSLSFDGDHVQEDEEELLEALEPPSHLEELSIEEYKGKTLFPSWMMKLNLLRKLTINNSRNCEDLPPLGKLSCLEELEIYDINVKRVGVEFMGIEKEKDASTSFLSIFPKLKRLDFWDFLKWEEWDDIDEWLMERINNKTITIMPLLQELYIYGCQKLKTLPYHLLSPPITTELQNLRISYCDVLQQEVQKDKLSHISRLTIQSVAVFIVSVNEDESSSIVEMEKLNNLRGKLDIRGLGNVRKLQEARKAQLQRKKSVTELSLSFDGDHVQEDEEGLLETLKPPSHLEELSIEEYKGKTLFPSWMMKLNLLRKLEIRRCENCEELPPLGKLSCLEELEIYDINVKRVGVEFMGIKKEKDASSFLSFPKLKKLKFWDCREWKEWDDIDEWLMERINNKTITVLPCLQELTLYFCPKLKILPYHLLSLTIKLQELDICDCYVLQQEIQKDKLSHISRLTIPSATVFIVRVNEDESSSIVEMEKLNNLRGRLEIRGLGNVRKLEEAKKAQLQKKKSITDLSLSFDGDHVQEDEEELLEALEPPSDLEELSIEEYKGKSLFPSWMMKLNLLKELWIRNCEKCEELPLLGKLPCLEELYVQNMGVKRVGVEFMGIEKEKDASTSFLSFPKLKILSFVALTEWKEWEDIDEWLMERVNNKTITIMPSLQRLIICECQKLKTLPYHLLSPPITTGLQNLLISCCNVLQQEIQKDKLSHIPHLKILSELEEEEEEKTNKHCFPMYQIRERLCQDRGICF